jgi:hypothetical protein
MAVLARTLAEYRSELQHALGGAAPASQLAQDTIINDAGRHLVSMHPWKWLERTPGTLNFAQDTAYVSMPSDFKSLDTIVPDDEIDATFTLTSFYEIARMRQFEITLTAAYYGALVWPGQASATALQTVPRLELYPTPSANATGALHIWYTRGWTVIDDATDAPNIPWFMESLLVQLVRAFAQGYEESDVGSLNQRLADVTGTRDNPSPIFAAALSEDGMIQPDLDTIEGGWTDIQPTPLNWNPVSDPS